MPRTEKRSDGIAGSRRHQECHPGGYLTGEIRVMLLGVPFTHAGSTADSRVA